MFEKAIRIVYYGPEPGEILAYGLFDGRGVSDAKVERNGMVRCWAMLDANGGIVAKGSPADLGIKRRVIAGEILRLSIARREPAPPAPPDVQAIIDAINKSRVARGTPAVAYAASGGSSVSSRSEVRTPTHQIGGWAFPVDPAVTDFVDDDRAWPASALHSPEVAAILGAIEAKCPSLSAADYARIAEILAEYDIEPKF